MHEPILALRRVYPAALMRTIHRRLTLFQDSLALVRTVRTHRTHDELPPRLDTTGRTHDPIPSVTLVELRTFCRIVAVASIEDDYRIPNLACAVGRKFTHREHRVKTDPRVCPTIDKIATAIVVPQRTGIYHALSRDDTHRFLPRSRRILRLHHHHPAIRIAPIDIEFAIVMTNAGCPNTISVLRQLSWELTLQSMSDDGPIHQILGMQDWQTRHALE